MYKDFLGNEVTTGEIVIFTPYSRRASALDFKLAIFEEQKEDGVKFKFLVFNNGTNRFEQKVRLRDKPFIKITPNMLLNNEEMKNEHQQILNHSLRILKSNRY